MQKSDLGALMLAIMLVTASDGFNEIGGAAISPIGNVGAEKVCKTGRKTGRKKSDRQYRGRKSP